MASAAESSGVTAEGVVEGVMDGEEEGVVETQAKLHHPYETQCEKTMQETMQEETLLETQQETQQETHCEEMAHETQDGEAQGDDVLMDDAEGVAVATRETDQIGDAGDSGEAGGEAGGEADVEADGEADEEADMEAECSVEADDTQPEPRPTITKPKRGSSGFFFYLREVHGGRPSKQSGVDWKALDEERRARREFSETPLPPHTHNISLLFPQPL